MDVPEGIFGRIAGRVYAWATGRTDVQAVRLATRDGAIRCGVLARSTNPGTDLSDAASDIDIGLANDPETKGIDFDIMLQPVECEALLDDWLREWRRFEDL